MLNITEIYIVQKFMLLCYKNFAMSIYIPLKFGNFSNNFIINISLLFKFLFKNIIWSTRNKTIKHKEKSQNNDLKKIALDKKLLRQTHNNKPKPSAQISITINTNPAHYILDHTEPRVLNDLNLPYTNKALCSLLKTI
jgi:hypothetical protein